MDQWPVQTQAMDLLQLQWAESNHAEDWHSRLKQIVGKPHLNIFEIVYVIKKEQAPTEMKLEQFAQCNHLERRDTSTLSNDQSSLAKYLASFNETPNWTLVIEQ